MKGPNVKYRLDSWTGVVKSVIISFNTANSYSGIAPPIGLGLLGQLVPLCLASHTIVCIHEHYSSAYDKG